LPSSAGRAASRSQSTSSSRDARRLTTEYLAARALVLESAAPTIVHGPAHGTCRSKYFASEAVGRIADRAVQIHGGAGYMRGVPVERLYRDARLFRIYEEQPDPATRHRRPDGAQCGSARGRIGLTQLVRRGPEAQPFTDGNKRTALAVILTFLAINGFRVEASDRELAGWVIGLSAGTTSSSSPS